MQHHASGVVETRLFMLWEKYRYLSELCFASPWNAGRATTSRCSINRLARSGNENADAATCHVLIDCWNIELHGLTWVAANYGTLPLGGNEDELSNRLDVRGA